MTILLGVVLGLWVVGFLLLDRLRPCTVAATPCQARPVSVIIPARNEEHNIARLLRSLAQQGEKPAEVLVVDDGSTDRTAELAAKLGARVITSGPLPEGWRGKTWACHQGGLAATGELLLFVDADTWFERDALARLMTSYPGGAFSMSPYHAVERLYEDLSLFFNFNMTFGTIPHGLFGQLLLIERAAYEQAGGHAAVRGRILENFRLAGHLRSQGVPVRSVLGRTVTSFRMYPGGLRELMAGWTKGFASGAGHTPAATLLVIVAWMIGLMLAPLAWCLGGGWWPLGAAYGLCVAQVRWFSVKVGSFGWLSAILYPVPLVFFLFLFAWSASRSGKPVQWKGREIHAD
jgi:4,4'-diaponeurosporenoate glycosyltransferase